jgi:signal transduction histidine kinase
VPRGAEAGTIQPFPTSPGLGVPPQGRKGSALGRARRAPTLVIDTALALVILTIGLVDLVVLPPGPIPGWRPGLPLLVVASLSLSVRRRHPWVTYGVFLYCAIVGFLAHYFSMFFLGGELAGTIVAFTVADQSGPIVSALAATGEVAAWVIAFMRGPLAPFGASDIASLILLYGSLFGLAWVTGRVRQRRRRLTSELATRAAELRQERERLARHAVTRERRRLADELRSLVIQGIREMAEQARMAVRQLRHDPTVAAETIGDVENTGRRTLVEMRRLLGLLRKVEDSTTTEEMSGAHNGGLGGTIALGTFTFETHPWYDDSSHRLRVLEHPRDKEPSASGRRLIDSSFAMVRGATREQWVVDSSLAALVGCAMVLEFLTNNSKLASGAAHGWVAGLLAVTMVLALLFRRTAPFTMLVIVSVAECLWTLILGNTPGTADRIVVIAVYTVGAMRDWRWAVGAVAIGTASWVPLPLQNLCTCMLFIGALATFAAMAGHSVRESRRLHAELRDQTEDLVRTREERIRLAVSEERLRVARDLHDVVAHGVTVMVVQAGAARALAPKDLPGAYEALKAVERTGDESLGELRSLVESLGSGPDEGEENLPGLEQQSLPSLVDEARRNGLHVELQIEGQPGPMDAGLDLSLYRIVQEALTNVRKHAPDARVLIKVRYVPDELDVDVTDSGSIHGLSMKTIPGSGQGLVGIAERAALFGGEAEAGPTLEGGFRVWARLPTEPVMV